ncbi:hypothetical protein AMAG_01465 [Allomyces macrogynus ATCC 38327]|uniref:Uncharacterized protein n=1 Tax=Allomyces macrogynus (strain ATCC 38327) TaxID=578462 RepID=A0A0L0RZU1_ALLM3|nr:hypothetical protein AMAG_01465 [Allomyces macrogynus ATCC 38327]|eukprot:KNE55574.1 hypothetical protein AMAG_01465 [Allomyces macrogynus ATCC 38327]
MSVRAIGARVLSRWIPAQAVTATATAAARGTARIVVSGSPSWHAFARATQSAHMVLARSTPRLMSALAAILLALFQVPLIELSEDDYSDDVSFTSHSSWEDDDDDYTLYGGDNVDALVADSSADTAVQTVDLAPEPLALSDRLPENSGRNGAGFAVRDGAVDDDRAGSDA